MARKGDYVECTHCGQLLQLDNNRVPWHKRAGRTCSASGIPADNWDTVQAVGIEGVPHIVTCPKCGAKQGAANVPDSDAVLCGKCGHVDHVVKFLKSASKPELPTAPRRSRYGSR